MFDTLVGPDTVCAFTEVVFERESLLLPADQFTWSAVPANGATLLAQGTPQGRFVFDQPGTYRIQVIGRNTPANCQATAIHTVHVVAPSLDFTTPDTRQDCAPKTFDFRALAPTAVRFTWNFGDGTPAITTTDSLISHRYRRNGRYDVTLSVVDARGCTNTLTKPAYVHVAGPQPRLELSRQSGCDSATLTFTNLSLDADSLWFELGDGTPLNTNAFRASSQLMHTYRFPPNTTANDSVFVFYPLLFLRDAAGCDVLFSDSLDLRVELRRTPQLSIVVAPQQACSPLLLQPLAQTRYADRVLWYLDNDPVPVASGWAPTIPLEALGGNRDVVLRAEAWHVDCRAEVSDTIRVWALPELAYTASTDSICPDDPLTLSYSGPAFNLPLQSVRWTLPDGSQQTGETVQYTVGRGDADSLRLAVTDANGCFSEGSLPVTWALYDWQPIVRLSAPPDTAALLFAPARVQGELTAPDVLDVQWWLDGNPAASGRLFDLTLPDTGIYTLTAVLITANGCPDTVRVGTYRVLPLKFFAPNVFTPNGDGVNDRFAVEYEGDGSFALWIYDRQGQLMFRSESVQQTWDGTRGGKPAITGTYFYVVQAGGNSYTGSFSLIR
jgi:gliding motility-associated-like protein